MLFSQLSFCGHYPESEGNSSLFLLAKTSGWTQKVLVLDLQRGHTVNYATQKPPFLFSSDLKHSPTGLSWLCQVINVIITPLMLIFRCKLCRNATSTWPWCPLPRKFLMKSSNSIFRSGLIFGLYMSVLSRMMAKARMKMVSGLWNCCTTSGLHMQYRWLWV